MRRNNERNDELCDRTCSLNVHIHNEWLLAGLEPLRLLLVARALVSVCESRVVCVSVRVCECPSILQLGVD